MTPVNLTYKRETGSQTENSLAAAKRDRVGGGVGCAFGIPVCKLLYTGWVNKSPPQTTEYSEVYSISSDTPSRVEKNMKTDR